MRLDKREGPNCTVAFPLKKSLNYRGGSLELAIEGHVSVDRAITAGMQKWGCHGVMGPDGEGFAGVSTGF